MEDKKLIELSGTVDDITFKSEETGFTVLTLSVDGDPITAVGEMPFVNEGEELHLYGNYATHPQYGAQFKVEACHVDLPSTANSMFKYLAGGAIKGIGPATARRIVDEFGGDALDIIEKHPEMLAKIKGMTIAKAEKISEEFQRIAGVRTVMAFFSKYGISLSDSIKIFKKFSSAAVEIISANPYRLCDADFSFDFGRADKIAMELGFNEDNDLRIGAAVKYVLLHNSGNGHTCLPIDKLISAASRLCGAERSATDDVLRRLVSDGELICVELCGSKFIFLPDFYTAEAGIAERLNFSFSIMHEAVKGQETKIENRVLRQISDQEKILKIQYADLQKEAILKAALNPIFILTGGPGTGKTTTINGMIRYFEFTEKKIFLAAPTGRAAKRMTEVSGREAKTIHRLLEVDVGKEGRFKHNENDPLDCEVLIVDEMSMVDSHLFFSLLRALKPSCKLILVGDSNQLPSVGAGNVLNDLISSGVLPFVCLNQVFRQAAESMIVMGAHDVIAGRMPDLSVKDKDFFFIKCKDDLDSVLGGLYNDRLPKAYGYIPGEDIQIITPSKKGKYGTYLINEKMRDWGNPKSENKNEVKIKSVMFREGDRVIQRRNNYDIIWHRLGKEGMGVFNGDIGTVERIDKKEQVLEIAFDDRIALYNYEWAEDLDLAYAITVHKSQGSEYNAVILVLGDYFEKLYFRNLFYTAITRAKKQLIILGTEDKVKKMVENNRKSLRYTGLKHFLTGEFLVFPEL